LPEAVQVDAVADANLTLRPDEAVAVTVNGAVPNGWFGSGANVMLCVNLLTGKLCVTGVAGA
jgi:hypothetical protein